MGDFRDAMSKVFDVINKVCAIVLLVTYVLFAFNANLDFIHNDVIMGLINFIMYYGPLIIAALVCVEFAIKRNIIIQIIIYALIALVVIFQFFPGTWNAFMGG